MIGRSFEVGNDVPSGLGVVLHDLALAEAGLGVHDFVQIREGNLSASNLDGRECHNEFLQCQEEGFYERQERNSIEQFGLLAAAAPNFGGWVRVCC